MSQVEVKTTTKADLMNRSKRLTELLVIEASPNIVAEHLQSIIHAGRSIYGDEFFYDELEQLELEKSKGQSSSPP